jgi:hypothetical protein
MNIFPKSRDAEIVTQELANELLIYDLTNHRAIGLNETSVAVWQNCDGKTSIAEIAQRENLPPEFVLIALDELQKADLMAEKIELEIPTDRFSRRKMLLKVATTAAALPMIKTLVAPTAIQAQSSNCIGNGDSFDLTSNPFFADANECVAALVAQATITCCSGVLNPAGAFTFTSNPPLCRGFCG